MSGFRRRLMGASNTLDNCELVTEMFMDTDTTSVKIPKGALAMDIFLVGGGGGGGSWNTWGCSPGSPGLGGECFCKRRIPLHNVTNISIVCGNGGNCATSRECLIRSATDGGVTTLTTNIETYSAKGGIGGYNSMNQSGVTTHTYPSGNTSHVPVFVSKCTDQIGYDNRVMTEYGLEGTYMKGLETGDFDHWANVYGVYSDEESVEFKIQRDSVAYPAFAETYRYGVPAFYEEGNCTFAAQGSLLWNVRHSTTYGTQGSAVYNSSENVAKYNASGFGGGGFGGGFRTSSLWFGGNGTQGIVIIRWYIKKGIKTTTIRIDQNISDPATMITRIEDNGGIEVIRYNSHRYVGTFDSTTNIMSLKQLHDYDGTRYTNGTIADITTLGNDVWMKLPQFWYKAEEYDTDVWDITFAYGGKPDSTFKEWDGKNLIGVYEAYVSSGLMYSVSGRTSTGYISKINSKDYSRNRGLGFTAIKWNQNCMMSFLFLGWYHYTSKANTIGSGSSSYSLSTGGTNDIGMKDTAKSSDYTNFWGLENFWNCKTEWVDNITGDNGIICIDEDDGTQRCFEGVIGRAALRKIMIGEHLDIAATEVSSTEYAFGNAPWYFTAGSELGALRGGYQNYWDICATNFENSATHTADIIGSRLSYRGDYIITD